MPDVIAMAVLAGESLEDDEDDDDDAKRSSKKKHSHKGKEKHKEKHNAGSDFESDNTRSSLEGDSGSSSEGEREKATKKSHRREWEGGREFVWDYSLKIFQGYMVYSLQESRACARGMCFKQQMVCDLHYCDAQHRGLLL